MSRGTCQRATSLHWPDRKRHDSIGDQHLNVTTDSLGRHSPFSRMLKSIEREHKNDKWSVTSSQQVKPVERGQRERERGERQRQKARERDTDQHSNLHSLPFCVRQDGDGEEQKSWMVRICSSHKTSFDRCQPIIAIRHHSICMSISGSFLTLWNVKQLTKVDSTALILIYNHFDVELRHTMSSTRVSYVPSENGR